MVNVFEELREINHHLPFNDPIELTPYETLTLKCLAIGCWKTFKWTPKGPNEQPPAYHNRHCKNRYKDKKSNVQCPFPNKKKYDSEVQAVKDISAMRIRLKDAADGLIYYRCICGGLHIGHRVGAKIQRPEDALLVDRKYTTKP